MRWPLYLHRVMQQQVRMKSKDKMKSLSNNNPQPYKQEGLIFQTPEMEAILKLKQKYERNVEQTVHLIQDLNFNKMPQKCIHHNNNFTLYCQNDQKPLCASCMYQNQVHKIHKVIPLSASADFIKRDCDKLEKELGFIVDNMNGLVKHVNDGIARMDKDFPHLVWRIQDCYKRLHNFLLDREKEHVNELRYYKERMKYQHGALSTELTKISIYIQEKMEQYSRRNENDSLLAKRNVFDSLKNSAKIVADQLNIKEEESGPKMDFTIFSQIQQIIYARLPRLFVKDSDRKSQKNLYHVPSSKRINSKSKQKQSFSPVSIPEKQQPKKLLPQKQKPIKTRSRSTQRVDRSPKKTPTKSTRPAKPTSKTPPKTPPKSKSKSNLKTASKKSPTRDQRSSRKNSGSKKNSRNQSPVRK